jgi:DHA2 family multidrug resistance protein-like MFS transporter
MTAVDVPAKAGWRQWVGLLVLCLPTMLTTVDITVTILALPHMSADLGASGIQQLWITDIYGFMIAGFLITMGNLGDRIGRRKLLLIGAAVFIVASVVAAYANSTGLLIASRAALGIAGATVAPNVLALIQRMFKDPKQMGAAMGVWGTSIMLGVILGPVVGGLLLSSFWWGSIFLMGVPVMGLLLLAGPFLLSEFRNPDAGRTDLLSVLLSLAGILPVIYGFKELARGGWTVVSAVAIVAGALFLTVFVRRQRKLADPLLDVSLFSNPVLSGALVMATLFSFVMGGVGLMTSLHMQLVEGFTPVVVGLWLLIPSFAMVIGSGLSTGLARKVRPAFVVAAGLAVAAAGSVVLIFVSTSAGLGLILPGLILVYLGGSPVGVITPFLIMSSAPPEKAGSAGSLQATGGEFGAAMGVAIAGLIGTAVYRGELVVPAGVGPDAAASAEASVAGGVATAAQTPGPAGGQLLSAAREAFTSGLNVVATVTAVVLAALAVFAAARLRRVPPTGAVQGAPAPEEGAAEVVPEAIN